MVVVWSCLRHGLINSCFEGIGKEMGLMGWEMG